MAERHPATLAIDVCDDLAMRPWWKPQPAAGPQARFAAAEDGFVELSLLRAFPVATIIEAASQLFGGNSFVRTVAHGD